MAAFFARAVQGGIVGKGLIKVFKEQRSNKG